MKGFASSRVSGALWAAAFTAFAAYGNAADLSLPVTGNLLGSVLDSRGTPQMGATVQLFNKFQTLVAKTTTAPDGRFGFAGLPVDIYSVRVSLASFLPVARDKIAVKAGLDSMLQIHLATLLSSIEVRYTLPTAAMSDDWKWVLRSSPATRPITRFLPQEVSAKARRPQILPSIFSETHAMLSLSGGDNSAIDSDYSQAGMGTGFALSTSILGKNQVQVGGTLGQGSTFGPGAFGLAAIYSRSENGGFGQPPEVTFTLSQVGVAGGQAAANTQNLGGSVPPVRTMSLSVYQVTDPLSGVHIEYGMTAESVDYLQHSSRISPFSRVTVSLGRSGELVASYSDGARPDQLAAHRNQSQDEGATTPDLASAVNTVSRLPQLSYGNGRLELQRTQSSEVGYRKTAGSRTYAVSAFHENVSNGRINLAGDTEDVNPQNLLSDGVSEMLIYNVGRYQRNGLVASVSQHLNDSLDLGLAYGRAGGFTAATPDLNSFTGAGTSFLDQRSHNLANVSLKAKAPRTGTQIAANYGWMDDNAVVPRHFLTTQDTYLSPGFNVLIRQPLPSPFGMPGRLELTADLRNLLAQGYLPVNTSAGRTLLVVQSPRAVRGGLSFIF